MTIQLPEHISFSQYNTYVNCPRSWYLGKVVKAPERQTWYLPIGTAVHQMVENYLAEDWEGLEFPSAESFFYPLIEKQMEIEPDTAQWYAGGPKADPVTEYKALQKVKDCFEAAVEFLEDWDVWEVEYDASGRLPGLEPEVKAFVDIIGEYRGPKKKWRGPGIVDWKSGSKKPKDNFQLETYQSLLLSGGWMDLNGGIPAKVTGFWAMLDPNAAEARPIDLTSIDPAMIGSKYQKVWRGMKSMQIQANQQYMCKMCFHRDSCQEFSGLTAQTIKYDRSHIDQPGF
jgi:putative RecB family exonuclease